MSTDSTFVTREEFDKTLKDLEKRMKKQASPVPKEPKAPRAPTDYNNFIKENMSKIKDKNPGIKTTEAMKMCGALWRDQKKPVSKET